MPCEEAETAMRIKEERFDALRLVLEVQFQQHTRELTELTVYSSHPERIGYDRSTIGGRIASTRQALADTTQALRRIAEGNYGRCERCETEIPLERLEIRPQARYCVPCQQTS